MKTKKVFYSELAYIIGLVALAVSTALMERADFGVSMVVAPAYLLHLKISEFLPFFSFGMAEYTLQAIILIFMMILLRRVKLSYFFSFVTAVIYGFLLDGAMALLALVPPTHIAIDAILYVIGMLTCSFGVAMLFHTYISPEVYELFVKEVSQKFGLDLHKFKTCYDCTSFLISVAMSFAFFGLWNFEGIKLGTVVCALLNGTLIKLLSSLLEKHLVFEDKFKLRKYF